MAGPTRRGGRPPPGDRVGCKPGLQRSTRQRPPARRRVGCKPGLQRPGPARVSGSARGPPLDRAGVGPGRGSTRSHDGAGAWLVNRVYSATGRRDGRGPLRFLPAIGTGASSRRSGPALVNPVYAAGLGQRLPRTQRWTELGVPTRPGTGCSFPVIRGSAVNRVYKRPARRGRPRSDGPELGAGSMWFAGSLRLLPAGRCKPGLQRSTPAAAGRSATSRGGAGSG
jgi:hypothetical protein